MQPSLLLLSSKPHSKRKGRITRMVLNPGCATRILAVGLAMEESLQVWQRAILSLHQYTPRKVDHPSAMKNLLRE